MRATAKVRNTSSRVVIEGGGKVTLSWAGIRRILYMDTCDKRQVCRTGPALTSPRVCGYRVRQQLRPERRRIPSRNSGARKVSWGGKDARRR